MDVILKVKNIDKNVIDLLEQNGLELEHILKVAPVILGKTDNPSLLNELPFVEALEYNELFEPQNIQMMPNIRPNKLKRDNYTGVNSVVAVIDTGIDEDVVQLLRSEVFSSSMSTRDTRPKNKCHGTIVARVIRQIAPWSNIINSTFPA